METIPIKVLKNNYVNDFSFYQITCEGEIEEEIESKNFSHIPTEEFVDIAYKNRELFQQLPLKYKQKLLNGETFSVRIPTYKIITFNINEEQ